jgi:hypothetical protein
MAEIITSGDLEKPLVGVNGQPTGEIKTATNTIKELSELANTVNSIIDKIQTMRMKNIPQQPPMPQVIQGNAGDMPSTKETTIEVIKAKPIDRVQLRSFLYDLIMIQSDKLPLDVKEMKIKDLTGEGFAKFKYKYEALDMEITGDQILDVITNQMAQSIDKINGCG